MLQKLHDHIKGWVAAVVIGLVCLAFVLWGVQSYVTHGSAKGETLATVDGQKVTEKDVDFAYQQLLRQVSQNTTLTAEIRKQLRQMALDRVVMQTLLAKAASKSGFYVDQTQAQQVIMGIPEFQTQGKFSSVLFHRFLNYSGLTQAQFFSEVKTSLLIAQPSSGIQLSTFVLPAELKTYYGLINQRRDFSYLLVPAKKFANQVKVSQADIKTYYKNNQAQFKTPEQVSVSYLEISPEDLTSKIAISEAQLQQYYDNNLGNYRTPELWEVERVSIPVASFSDKEEVVKAREKMQSLLQELKKGASFSTLLGNKRESLTVGKSEEAVIKVAKTLKPGEVSTPFTTEGGYALIRLIKRTPSKTKSFSKVKNSIKVMLVNQEAQQQLAELSDQLTSLTYTNADSLQPAATELKLSVKRSPLFTRKGTATGIASDPKVVEAAFGEEVLQEENNSNVLTLKNGSLVVLRNHQHLKSSVKPFNKVAPGIRAKLRQQNEQAKALLFAQKLQTALAKGEDAEALATQHQLTWVHKVKVARTDKTVKPALLASTAFGLSLGSAKRTAAISLEDGSAALVRLEKIIVPQFDKANKKELQELSKQLQQFLSGLSYQLYVNSVKENAKLEYTQGK